MPDDKGLWMSVCPRDLILIPGLERGIIKMYFQVGYNHIVASERQLRRQRNSHVRSG